MSLEPHLLVHVLSLYQTLLSIGAVETDDLLKTNTDITVGETDALPNLATNISAVMRRTLPAMRILSKWILSQLEYVQRIQSRVEAKERANARRVDRSEDSDDGVDVVEEEEEGTIESEQVQNAIDQFWRSYVRFANTLLRAFPIERLPTEAMTGKIWLEEDVDMLGFAPLRRGMKDGEGNGRVVGGLGEIARVGRDVHPNEEQLMRIGEIIRDAKEIAKVEVSFCVAFISESSCASEKN